MFKLTLPAHRATHGPDMILALRHAAAIAAETVLAAASFRMHSLWQGSVRVMLMRHFPARTYALAFALGGFRDIDAPRTAGRQAGRGLAAAGLGGQVPSRPGRPRSRSRCHHASRTPFRVMALSLKAPSLARIV